MAIQKHPQEESFETAEGFQIEDMDGNSIEDDYGDEDDASAMRVIDEEVDEDEERRRKFWEDDEEDEDDDTFGEDLFNSMADNSNWEEGYDY